jgi:hypothetical protein
MAERMVVRAVVDAYTVPPQRVERLLTTTGDLGTGAETLAAAERGRAASILYVFDELRNTARIAGKGSQALTPAALILINIAGARLPLRQIFSRKATIAVTQALSPTWRVPDALNCSNSGALSLRKPLRNMNLHVDIEVARDPPPKARQALAARPQYEVRPRAGGHI